MELDSTLEGLNSNPRIIVLYSWLKHLYFHSVKSTRDFEKSLWYVRESAVAVLGRMDWHLNQEERQNYPCPHATKLCELVSHSFVSSLMGVLFQHLWSVPYFQRPKWVDQENRIFSWFDIILTSFSKFFNRSRRIFQFSKVRLFLKQYRYFANQESALKLQSRFISPKQRILHRTAD